MLMANFPLLAQAASGTTTNGEAASTVKQYASLGDFLEHIWHAILNALPTIFFAALILVIGLIFTRISVKLLSKGLSKTKVELTVVKFTTQLTRIVLYVLLVTIVLGVLGVPATSIITVIGTAGVAIGLALKDSLSNVAGGFLLMVTKPFKIGDYIITNGVEGTVSEISILHTTLNSASNQAIFIPNGQVFNAVVTNNSGNETRRVDLKISISYNDDFSKARNIILEIADRHPLILDSPTPFVRMSGHGASSIDIAVRVWVKTGNYADVTFDLTEQIRAAFIENNIEIPYNQLDVHLFNEKK